MIKKVLFRDGLEAYCVAQLKDAAAVEAAGNSKRLAEAVGGALVIAKTNGRIYAINNPDIATKLEAAGVDGWRVDNLQAAAVSLVKIDKTNWQARYYNINTETGEAAPVLDQSEAECKHCGRSVKKAEIINHYCLKCLYEGKDYDKDTALAARFSYHGYYGGYTIAEKVDEAKTPVFGCEIELDYKDRDYSGNFSQDLKAATLGACKILYNKLKKPAARRVVFMEDGSLNMDGCEVITTPATYSRYKKEANTWAGVFEVFNKNNFTRTSACGCHIHINRSFFEDPAGSKDASRYAAAKIAVLIAENWDQWRAIAKREGRRVEYASKPPQTKEDGIFTLARKTLENEYNHNTAINLQHDKTIEVRLWSGAAGVSDLLLYLDLTQALATFAKRKSLEATQRASVASVAAYIKDTEHLDEIAARLEAAGFTGDAAAVRELKNIKEAK